MRFFDNLKYVGERFGFDSGVSALGGSSLLLGKLKIGIGPLKLVRRPSIISLITLRLFSDRLRCFHLSYSACISRKVHTIFIIVPYLSKMKEKRNHTVEGVSLWIRYTRSSVQNTIEIEIFIEFVEGCLIISDRWESPL